MPSLKKIVDRLNIHLKEEVFKNSRFASARFVGITEPVAIDDNINCPAEIISSGEAIPVMPDDVNSMTVYHKVLSAVVSPYKSQGGRENNMLVRTAVCSMVVIAMREQLRMTPDELDLTFLGGLPNSFSHDDLQNMTLKSLNIRVLSSDFDSHGIFQREWPESGKPLSSDLFLLEIKYQIGCMFNKSCINQCCP